MSADPAPRAENRLVEFADKLGGGPVNRTAEPAMAQLHLVTFLLEREEFGIAIDQVCEVIGVNEVTRVPHAPAHVRGVINLRGRVLAVFDLRARMGLPSGSVTPKSRIIVVEVQERMLGCLVDAVIQVLKVPAAAAAAAPREALSPTTDFITGVVRLNSRLIVLLDLEKAVLTRD
jgi:purine-binding chemotaxis protein CheW